MVYEDTDTLFYTRNFDLCWCLIYRFEARFEAVVRESASEGAVRRSELATEARLSVVSRWSRSHRQEAEAIADFHAAGSSERGRATRLPHGAGLSLRGTSKGRCG